MKRVVKVEFSKLHFGCSSSHPYKPIPTIWRLTPAEARERREKGLCYHYPKLFWVEGLLEDEDEGEVVDSATVEVLEFGLGEAQEDDVAPEMSPDFGD
ncbi:hypothetical protein AMTRI_Chr05g62180 [Amborella trichopoda]